MPRAPRLGSLGTAPHRDIFIGLCCIGPHTSWPPTASSVLSFRHLSHHPFFLFCFLFTSPYLTFIYIIHDQVRNFSGAKSERDREPNKKWMDSARVLSNKLLRNWIRTEFKKRADRIIHPSNYCWTGINNPRLETFRMFRGVVIPRNVNKLINSTGTGQVMFIPMLQVFGRGTFSPSEYLKSKFSAHKHCREKETTWFWIIPSNSRLNVLWTIHTQRLTISEDIYTTLTHVTSITLRYDSSNESWLGRTRRQPSTASARLKLSVPLVSLLLFLFFPLLAPFFSSPRHFAKTDCPNLNQVLARLGRFEKAKTFLGQDFFLCPFSFSPGSLPSNHCRAKPTFSPCLMWLCFFFGLSACLHRVR